MKAISIRQPWAWSIMHAGKRVENREWPSPPTYRGPILIHAAKGCTREEYDRAIGCIFEANPLCTGVPALSRLERGGFVGRASLVDVHDQHNTARHRYPVGSKTCFGCGYARPSTEEIIRGAHPGPFACPRRDPWAAGGSFGLVLSRVESLPFVPWRGELGLFEADPPAYRGL